MTRRRLVRVIAALLAYEFLLFLAALLVLQRTARELASTGSTGFIETVPMPAWWAPLAIIPPVLWIGWIAGRVYGQYRSGRRAASAQAHRVEAPSPPEPVAAPPDQSPSPAPAPPPEQPPLA